MKNLETAIRNYEKAKARYEKAKARCDEELKKLRAAEAVKTEAENLQIVMSIRSLNIPVSELTAITGKIREGMTNVDELFAEQRNGNKDDREGNSDEKGN